MPCPNIYKVLEIKRQDMVILKTDLDSVNKYFRIISSDSTLRINSTYPIMLTKDIDTIKAISELLSYEGDIRLCVFPINNYSTISSQIYLGKKKNYSIQVEALFIINQLVYENPFNYASYPILVDQDTNNTSCIDGKIVTRAFKAYKEWYKVLKSKGIHYIKKKSLMPLDGSGIKWY
jgi:hypothetical protein